MNKKERKVVSFGKPPEGYVAGVGRGAKPISRTVKRKRDDDIEPSLNKRRNVEDKEKRHWIDRVEGEEEDETTDRTKFMAFNLKDERSEGKYLADGSYVLFQSKEKLDPWLEDVVKNEIVYEEKKKTTTEKKNEKPKMTIVEAAIAIRNVLSVNESVSAAMKRLAKLFRTQERKKKPWLKNNTKQKNSATENGVSQSDRDAAKRQFEQLTEAADIFLLNGVPNIYECT